MLAVRQRELLNKLKKSNLPHFKYQDAMEENIASQTQVENSD